MKSWTLLSFAVESRRHLWGGMLFSEVRLRFGARSSTQRLSCSLGHLATKSANQTSDRTDDKPQHSSSRCPLPIALDGGTITSRATKREGLAQSRAPVVNLLLKSHFWIGLRIF